MDNLTLSFIVIGVIVLFISVFVYYQEYKSKLH